MNDSSTSKKEMMFDPRPQTVVCSAVCLGNAMHITASVFIYDNENGL